MNSEPSSSSLTPSNFDEFNAELQASALKATRNALGLPSDVAFHRSMDFDFASQVDHFSSKVLSLTNRLLALVPAAGNTSRGKGKAKLESEDDVVDNFHFVVVDSMDKFFERTDICLDNVLGHTKPPAIAIKPFIQPVKKPIRSSQTTPVLQHISNLEKPQLSFKRKVENDQSPWYPALPHKYNAQVPLGFEYHFDPQSTPESTTLHPYRYEIKHISYPGRMFQNLAPVSPSDFEKTSFTWVSTTDDLQSMLAGLRQATEIAVDLEHHSYRSYAGFVCLMQISTRDKDWIVDTLVLRHELTDLNEVFTDPKITKVFHGAESDIVWLQQDFNIFVVNLFDTFHASKVLEFPRHGLANLLEMYCDFTADKRYQLADWRIRPLPKYMLDYARSDTHFLLYIYDNLRNALLDRARSRSRSNSPSMSPRVPTATDTAHTLIREVLSRSEETSLRLYEKELYDAQGGSGPNGWDTLARKWNKTAFLANIPNMGAVTLQHAVYQAVHKWRDTVARQDDESTRYILPNHFLFQLAERPPKDMTALLGVFHSIPPIIRKHARGLLQAIRDCLKDHSTSLSVPSLPAHPTKSSELDSTDTSAQPQAKSTESSLSSLWACNSSNPAASASSRLFGSTLSTFRRTSLLFSSHKEAPSGTFPSQNYAKENPEFDAHFCNVVTRINSTLIIAPSLPKVVHEASPEDTAESVILAASGNQTEIPFVPSSRRTATRPIEDSIVVFGQTRQKKRKRDKVILGGTPPASAEESVPKTDPQSASVGDTHEPEDHEPFDFETVPNILDDNPNLDLEDTKPKKRRKKQKNGGHFYGDFPAPPKARSEVKRGNQSHTFK